MIPTLTKEDKKKKKKKKGLEFNELVQCSQYQLCWLYRATSMTGLDKNAFIVDISREDRNL